MLRYYQSLPQALAGKNPNGLTPKLRGVHDLFAMFRSTLPAPAQPLQCTKDSDLCSMGSATVSSELNETGFAGLSERDQSRHKELEDSQ
jgi:hypothetical protein